MRKEAKNVLAETGEHLINPEEGVLLIHEGRSARTLLHQARKILKTRS